MNILIVGDGGAAELAARICHEANTVLQDAGGEAVSPAWEDLDDETRESGLSGIRFAWENPELTPADQHEEWCRFKLEAGWTHGEAKDSEAKTHPCLVPYAELPPLQKAKDGVFRAVALALGQVQKAEVCWEPVTGNYLYGVYGAAADWKNFMGLPMPTWDDLPESVRSYWEAVASHLEPFLTHSAVQSVGAMLNPTAESRGFRKDLDAVLQRLKTSARKSRSRSLAVTHLEDAILRLGMDLKEQREEELHDEPGPYPNSYDPASTAAIAPTADGLTL